MGNEVVLFAEDPSVLFVCLLGVGVVFLGLVCIIGLIELMTFLCNKFAKQPAKVSESAPAVTESTEIPNRSELVAAVCAAVAEENGTDISAIRVISFRKID